MSDTGPRDRAACVAASWSPTARLHVGNLAWSDSGGDGSLAPTHRLGWGSPLHGFGDVWLEGGHAEVSLHVDPRAGAGLHGDVVADVVGLAPTVTLEVSREDRSLVAALVAAGFTEVGGAWFVQLWRDLGDLSDLGSPTPPGYRVRATRPVEVVERAALHRRCWAPARIKALLGVPVTGDEPESGYDVARHRAVASSTIYRPVLDVVAEAPDGSLAAYGLGWFDPVSRSVLLEPVGTDPAHGARGLARVVCAHVLRAAARLGATCAVVAPRGDDAYPVPRRVYAGLGMTEVARHVGYKRG